MNNYEQFLETFPMQDRLYQTFDDSGAGNQSLVRANGKITEEELLSLNKKGAGIFFTPNTFRDNKRKTETLKAIEWLYVDMDDGEKDEMKIAIEMSPIKPTLIIETKKGFHVYFKVNGQFELAKWDGVIRSMIQFFRSDKAAKDVCRVLRVPGFYHLKDLTDPYEIKIVSLNKESYTQEQLVKAFPPVIDEVKYYEKTEKKGFKTIPIKDVLSKLGVDVRGNAIFEGGQETSARIKVTENFINRFSGKEGSGSVIDAVISYGSMTKPEAYEWLRKNYPEYDTEPIKKEEEDKPNIRYTSWRETLNKAINTKKDINDFLSFGYTFLDKELKGILEGELLLIGGITNTGKSSLAMKIAVNAGNQGKKVCVAALEERKVELANKAICSKLNANRRKQGKRTFKYIDYRSGEADFDRQEEIIAARSLDASLDMLEVEHQLTFDDLEGVYKRGYDLIVLDHLHYFGNMNKDNISKANLVEEAVKNIKFLTNKYKTRTILVAHFTKLDESKRPTMTDFKDSVSIPQTADTIMLLWRDKSDSDDRQLQYQTEFIIPKSRLGVPSFTTKAEFNPHTLDYNDFKPVSYGTKNSESRQKVSTMSEESIKNLLSI